jgi:hypothetical protein
MSTPNRHAYLVLAHKAPRQINLLTRLLTDASGLNPARTRGASGGATPRPETDASGLNPARTRGASGGAAPRPETNAGGRTDGYLHLDAKAYRLAPDIMPRPNLFVGSRHAVRWGGFEMVRATLDLLRLARARERYAWLHLISGQCLP